MSTAVRQDLNRVNRDNPCELSAQYEGVYARHRLRELLRSVSEPSAGVLSHELKAFAPLTQQDLDRYADCLRPLLRENGSRLPLLLDAAAGLGGIGWWLGSRIPCSSIAIDFAVAACRLGVEHFATKSSSVEFVAGDLRNLPFGNESLSGIISIDGLYLVPERARAVSEMARVLRPGGPLLFTILATPSSGRDDFRETWIELLEGHAFTVRTCEDTTDSWRREMYRRHAARWVKREEILRVVGPKAASELAVTRAMLGVDSDVSVIEQTHRAEILAVQNDRLR